MIATSNIYKRIIYKDSQLIKIYMRIFCVEWDNYVLNTEIHCKLRYLHIYSTLDFHRKCPTPQGLVHIALGMFPLQTETLSQFSLRNQINISIHEKSMSVKAEKNGFLVNVSLFWIKLEFLEKMLFTY